MLPALVELGRFCGDPSNDVCILAEGNVSCIHDDDSFWVKASGCSLRDCDESAFVRVHFAPVLEALDRDLSVESVRQTLNDARCDDVAQIPSTETYMHAALLRMPGVKFVAHGHPTALLSLLSIEGASELAKKRLFPDEIVCCGPEACFVPYVAPGIELARAIVAAANEFRARLGIEPKTYWLQNHGLIAVGSTVGDVRSGLEMSVKAARVLLGSLFTEESVKWLTDEEVAAIFNWPDEHYRQARLRGEQ